MMDCQPSRLEEEKGSGDEAIRIISCSLFTCNYGLIAKDTGPSTTGDTAGVRSLALCLHVSYGELIRCSILQGLSLLEPLECEGGWAFCYHHQVEGVAFIDLLVLWLCKNFQYCKEGDGEEVIGGW